MKKNLTILGLIAFSFVFQNCGSVKVRDTWTGEEETVAKFKEKKILVLARTAGNTARIAFEEALANELRAKGYKATESFKKFPKIYTNREITDERVAFVQSILESEGYNGIVIVAVKDQQSTTTTSSSGIGVGVAARPGFYGGYPGYYGGFNNYYRTPYAYGPYYDSFGGYIPTSTSTSTSTTYILETVFYNLDEPQENQLVAVVTSELDDPKEAYKTAGKYVKTMVKAFQD
ncbi:hypothetical protein [uncultured Eudoraea sp.]|uniref:hypothetical protein n=1 Tax=uncultured Eudoraea sp. TaxID=1035614 RepID=UPI002636E42C|nr:hypothetical protein [uncultured Eudoraea sp.]